MPWGGIEPGSGLLLYTFLSFLNGALLTLLFAASPRLRRNAATRFAVLAYMVISIAAYLRVLSPDLLTRPAFVWHSVAAISGYFPVFVYLLSAAAETVSERILLSLCPERYDLTGQRTRAKWQRLARSAGNRHLLRAKREELVLRPTDARLRRELVEIYLSLDDADSALFHAYVLAELLPRGQAHALALYRTAQILVERKRNLAAAQPCLRRIVRLYPRSFFASYARRLVNHYEAYADLEA